MMDEYQINRRDFIKKSLVLTGSVFGAPTFLQGKNPSVKIGIGSIGVGHQGTYNLMRWAKEIPGVEIRAVNDVWDFHLNRGVQESGNPKVKAYTHYQKLLEDKDIDAVIIATPDHWHAPIVMDALDAGKHVYCEKALTVNLDLTKQVREKVLNSNLVFQLGHGGRSRGHNFRAKEIYDSGALGRVTFVRCHYFRNHRINNWREDQDAPAQIPADLTPEHLDWQQFLGPAPDRPFDPQRYRQWRNFWDYGTGYAGDLMSHHLDSINFILGTGIPTSCVTAGGIYYWDDGREVPDHWNAIFDWPDKNLCVTFSSEFNNSHYGTKIQFFGKDAAMEVNPGLKVFPEEVSDKYTEFIEPLKAEHGLQPEDSLGNIEVPAIYEWSDTDNQYKRSTHVGNFIDAIRDGVPVHCGIDAAFEEMATVMMSVEAYRQEKKMRWDPDNELIV
jgi:predicted dehydrogenase